MKNWKEKLLPAVFTLGGAVTGLAYYYTLGCTGGACAVTASPTRSMIYMAVIGWLLARLLVKDFVKKETEDAT